MIQLSDGGLSKPVEMERKVEVIKSVQGTKLIGTD